MLYLGGGGDIETSIEIDTAFFANLSDNAKILYIPVACDFTSYENCYQWFSGLVGEYLKSAQIEMMYDTVVSFDDYDAIYIGGGNTYKLLDYVVKNNLKNEFIKFLSANKHIFGGSAGAIIFGSDISTVVEEKENYADNRALDMVKGFAIRCHYESKDDDVFIKISNNIKKPLISLPEDGGLIIGENHFKVIGSVYKFNNGLKKKLIDEWAFTSNNKNLLTLILSGDKKATSSAFNLYKTANKPIPEVGDITLLISSNNTPQAMIINTKISVVPFSQATIEMAELEGEGNKTLEYWTATHFEFFTNECNKHNLSFNKNDLIVFEEFDIISANKKLISKELGKDYDKVNKKYFDIRENYEHRT